MVYNYNSLSVVLGGQLTPKMGGKFGCFSTKVNN
jgi:hypothetical protein